MSNEAQEIIDKWKKELADYEDSDILGRIDVATYMYRDTKKHPEIARELSNMLLKTIDKSKLGNHSRLLKNNIGGFTQLSTLDSKVLDDVFRFADKKEMWLSIYVDSDDNKNYFISAMNEGKISPKLLMENLSYDSLDAKALCVAKDPSLANEFLESDRFVKEKSHIEDFAYQPETLYQLSTQLDKLPKEMTPWLVNEVGQSDYWMRFDLKQKTLFNVVCHDTSYLPKVQKKGLRILNSKDAEFVAKLYEDMQNRVPDLSAKDIKKNQSVNVLKDALRDNLSLEDKQFLKSCEELLQGYKDRAALKVKLSKQYPMAAQTLDVGEDDYVTMCVNNLEHPEKENIRSILNRLDATEAKTYDDFAAAVDFVHRRDMCKKVCRDFDKAKNEEYQKRQGLADRLLTIDPGQLSYGMAEAGIKDKETAEKVVEMFYNLNDRPETYGSPYNIFYPDALVKLVDKPLEDWMYPVVKDAVRHNLVRADNLGSGVDLFAACKAWEINPYMPKAVAEEVGEMSLARRMVAGSIMDKILKEELQEARADENSRYYKWKNKYFSYYAEERNVNKSSTGKEIIPEFWKEMGRAQEMSFAEAMKTYIPNTSINRKRFASAMLEEMGIEATPESFKQAYDKLEKGDKFEEFLAAKGEDHTVVNPKMMLKAAKARKAIKEAKAQDEVSKDATPRERLAQKGIIPAKGKFGEGHKVKPSVKDMSQFADYTR